MVFLANKVSGLPSLAARRDLPSSIYMFIVYKRMRKVILQDLTPNTPVKNISVFYWAVEIIGKRMFDSFSLGEGWKDQDFLFF
jgi:hypothetical protein